MANRHTAGGGGGAGAAVANLVGTGRLGALIFISLRRPKSDFALFAIATPSKTTDETINRDSWTSYPQPLFFFVSMKP
jgi:hypothetical protein